MMLFIRDTKRTKTLYAIERIDACNDTSADSVALSAVRGCTNGLQAPVGEIGLGVTPSARCAPELFQFGV
jgi:hypothetical protein